MAQDGGVSRGLGGRVMDVIFGVKGPPLSPEDQAARELAHPPMVLRRIISTAVLLSSLAVLAWTIIRYTPLIQLAPLAGSLHMWQVMIPFVVFKLLSEGITGYYERRAARLTVKS